MKNYYKLVDEADKRAAEIWEPKIQETMDKLYLEKERINVLRKRLVKMDTESPEFTETVNRIIKYERAKDLHMQRIMMFQQSKAGCATNILKELERMECNG